ncbi:variant erythrocyte surface antigen-1 family protein [Babesia divergens]|uniref:Variant erythrocyte surface antigen-1 family protein n=1 Tax=Babesia divergens TaxID=32595 RepID=A0AAD9G5G3_BABDI|nr:variant erythrocyte surface antigen-1 family protein [Babesia divergens]
MFLGFTFLRSLVYSFHCLSLHCKVRMFFIPSCCPGCLCILVSLSVPRTLRSVLTGSLEPLRRTRLVCYMYYTDVFVGTDNIENLKDALDAELKDSGLTVDLTDLTQLVHGLCLFMGYPSCVCSLKVNVNKSLQDISKKLIQDSKAVQSSHSNLTLNLNCSNCESKNILCKCCVISCIKELPNKSKSQCKCPRLSNPSTECKCKEPKEKCCKDFLSGLEACLSLLNLRTDMQDCNCDPKTCCNNGTCNSTCTLCSPKNFSEFAMTGLGICPMNPKKLAEKLEKFFGDKGRKNSCSCNGSPCSCCCLACQSCSSQKSCFCLPNSKCSCASKTSPCPRQTFCSKIKDVKVLVRSKEMTCCNKGTQCHCQVEGSSNCSGSALNCCVVEDKSGAGSSDHYQQSVKCMIRRVVKFFASFDPSKPDCPKLCCEIFCVLKICVFLKMFYDKGNKKSCGTCRKEGGQGKPCPGSKITSSPNTCCGGNISKCKSPQCCSGCQECREIKEAKKFSRALQKLQYSGPCGLDLYRLLKDLLNFCSNVMAPNQDFIHDTVLKAVNSCNNCKKSGTDSKNWQPCECSKSGSSSNCQACTSLLGDSKLMSILRHGYLSSYDSSKASWDSLCPKPSSSTCCCGQDSSSCSQCSPSGCSSSCDPSKCCPDCPQRKAAKIFLGMLPCLYYGLKILHDRCKYGSGFAGWHDISVSNDKPESALAKFFHAWGYDLRPLISKKGSEFFSLLEKLFGSDSSGPLQKLSTLVTENYFTSNLISPSSDPSPPSTVRQMLLWLYGLRFQKHFSELVENCKSLCSPFGNLYNSDAFCYYIYTCCFLLPVSVISLIEDSLSITSLHSEFSKFFYPSDPSDLFEKLCEYARKIFVALAFLYYQCERNAGQGGWNDCAFGQGCVKKFQENSSGSPSTSVPSPSTSSSDCSCLYSKAYLCTAINKDPVHDHCRDGQTCLGFGSTSNSCTTHTSSTPKCTPCPHPLQRFLVDGSSESPSKSQSQNYPFGLSDITPMGFKSDSLPSPGRKGEKLYHALKDFCKDGFYPLTRLVQFILCVSQRPPETLGELFGFFKQFVSQLNSKDFKDHFVQWIEDEPGFYSGSDLKNALENLFNHSSGSPHSNDLRSLYYCDGPKGSGTPPTCGKYLHPLIQDAYNIFIDKFADTYLSWVCYRAKDFYSEFKAFYDKASTKFSCCLESSSCQKIVECPCALPFIYSLGFTFHSPGGLNCVNAQGQEHKNNEGTQKHTGGDENPGCTRKTCSQFLAQLKLVAEGDLFTKLLEEIEKFLWSIRKPFFLFVLAFWAFVISYFLYVQLYKLDVLELNSHDHPAWSFKIHPSTLFSDASSRLKDLSYFTL